MVAIIVIQTASTNLAFGMDGYSQLGTNKALGSPLLDANFDVDDWNKWETICWGVFLSNFASPLVDDYNSAFNSSSSTGSKGSGYKALNFGSGSDSANQEVIENLLDMAITQQREGSTKQLYVVYSDVNNGEIDYASFPTASGSSTGSGSSVDEEDDDYDENDEDYDDADDEDGDEESGIKDDELTGSYNQSGSIRPAKFKDFFLASSNSEGDSWLDIPDTNGVFSPSASSSSLTPIEGYIKIATPSNGSLPTFGVSYGTNYEVVWDYTNPWDIQLMAAWYTRLFCGDLTEEAIKNFNQLYESNPNLELDVFGNITAMLDSRRIMVMPAAANQHLTNDPSINMINSLVFNGFSSNLSSTEIALTGKQTESGLFDSNWVSKPRFSGTPAFGSHRTGVEPGTLFMFYDLDTILTQDSKTNNSLQYTKEITKLFDLSISNSVTNNYSLKIEPANLRKSSLSGVPKDIQQLVYNQVYASGQIANISTKGSGARVLTKLITPGESISLFGNPVIVPVQTETGRNKQGKVNIAGVNRLFINYLYDSYNSGSDTTAGNITRDYVIQLLDSSKNYKAFQSDLLINNGKYSLLLAGFLSEKSNLYKCNIGYDNLTRTSVGAVGTAESVFKNILNGNSVSATSNLDTSSGDVGEFPGRLVKAYPITDVMIQVGRVLGVREGTEFALYSPYIYLTYLDWYGITGNSNLVGNEKTSKFNTRIFDDKSDILNVVDITKLSQFTSVEDKKKDVLNYTYLMLHPTEGRDYRNGIISSGIADTIYSQYQKIVYGKASDYYSSTNSQLSSKSAAGFLNIDTYSENFTTGWLMKIYPKIAVWIIGFSLVIIIVSGLLKKKHLSWFFISFIVVVNGVLLAPSVGELTPYIANNWVQEIFSDKMTFWSISEAIENAEIEAKYIQDNNVGMLSSMSSKDRAKVAELVKAFNVVYLDRTLMLKSDISRKVTQSSYGNLAEVQRMRSARWMLPTIMRQFTANDGSADYVYIPMGDMYDNLSNLYWYYKPFDALSAQTINSQTGSSNSDSPVNVSGTAPSGDGIGASERVQYYPDYKDIGSIGVDSSNTDTFYKSLSRLKDDKDQVHTYSYLLSKEAKPLSGQSYMTDVEKDNKYFDEYAARVVKNVSLGELFKTEAKKLEEIGGTYSSSDRTTMNPEYGYLWATENPYHYFYEVIKDTLVGTTGETSYEDLNRSQTPTVNSLGGLAGAMQGSYVYKDESNPSEGEVRTSFMHMGKTGAVRDILDLEELFTNTVPYLYKMQVVAGGTNGDNGVLGDSKIEAYDIYTNNNKSWLFRSNWVTKLMENRDYSKPAKVKNKSGEWVEVEYPIWPESYPDDRPMIFSEAQMIAEGLDKSGLSLVELKCIEVNNNVSRRWTNLLNYVNISGMTQEVMFRQMATEAVLEFNQEFSPKGITGGAYAMYPQGVDLRAISFDSVMKMLMLNVTKDTYYIYGDTMKAIAEDSDIFTAILLLSSAFLCAYLIPFIRNIVLGMIFYLGFVSILEKLLLSADDNKQKLETSVGYIISNIAFLVMTLSYYTTFSVLMSVTSSDAVLTAESIQVNAGNPVWCFVIIILVSLVYIFGMVYMINFCFKNYRDMGFAVYKYMANAAASTLSNSFDKLSSTLSGSGGESVGVARAKGYGEKADTPLVKVDGGEIETTKENREPDNVRRMPDGQSSYVTHSKGRNEEFSDPSSIDAEIEEGRHRA